MSTTYSVLFGANIDIGNDDSGIEYSNLVARLNKHAAEKGKRRLSANLQLASSMDTKMRNKIFGMQDSLSEPPAAAGTSARIFKRQSVILTNNIELATPVTPSSVQSVIRRSIILPTADIDAIDDPKLLCKVFADKLLLVRRLERAIESCYAESRRTQALCRSASSSDRLVLEYLLERQDRLMSIKSDITDAREVVVSKYCKFRVDLEKRYLKALDVALRAAVTPVKSTVSIDVSDGTGEEKLLLYIDTDADRQSKGVADIKTIFGKLRAKESVETISLMDPCDNTVNTIQNIRSGMKSLERQVIATMENVQKSALAGSSSKFIDIHMNSTLTSLADELVLEQQLKSAKFNKQSRGNYFDGFTELISADFSSKLRCIHESITRMS
jgi:hypothetical protein